MADFFETHDVWSKRRARSEFRKARLLSSMKEIEASPESAAARTAEAAMIEQSRATIGAPLTEDEKLRRLAALPASNPAQGESIPYRPILKGRELRAFHDDLKRAAAGLDLSD